jgi:16S rRNA G1207 methylase RsmC
MPVCHCEATDRHFTIPRARDELATYHRQGPTRTARLMLQCLADLGSPPTSLLDVGAGIGVLHHVLLDRGVRHAVHLEAASAYVEVASEESARRGHAGRVTF